MNKIVLTFGLLSGGILGILMSILMSLCLSGALDFDQSEIIGYTTMVLALSMVFFGIRTYRQNVGGGVITFGRAFRVGILITLITSVIYVVAWEIVYYNFIPDFVDRYTVRMLEEMRNDGASAAAIAKKQKELAEFKVLYANPFFNVGMTFMEVFPVGLIVTLVSAAILRRKVPPEGTSPAAAMA